MLQFNTQADKLSPDSLHNGCFALFSLHSPLLLVNTKRKLNQYAPKGKCRHKKRLLWLAGVGILSGCGRHRLVFWATNNSPVYYFSITDTTVFYQSPVSREKTSVSHPDTRFPLSSHFPYISPVMTICITGDAGINVLSQLDTIHK